jgi:hypothetical protein
MLAFFGQNGVDIFDFRITGDPSDGQQQEAAFGFPNRFWITARPIHYQPMEQQTTGKP